MRFRRGPLRDVYVEDGHAAVFVNDQVVVLSEVATLILQATPLVGSTTIERVTAEVLNTVLPPEGPVNAAEVVERQVLDLVAHNVLVTTEVPEAPEITSASVTALRACLRHLSSASRSRWSLPHGVSGNALVAASERHRVTTVLASELNRLDLPPSAAAAISARTQQERATVGVLAAELGVAVDHLHATGVRCLVFKGLPLATQAYGDAAARGTGDLDLLVHPSDLERAYRGLLAAGWSSMSGLPTPGPSWSWRHLKRTGNEVSLISQSSMVDLHWHLTPARSATPEFDQLWARSVPVDVVGRSVRTLAPYDSLAHASGHATKDGWHWLRGLVDVHRLMSDRSTWKGAGYPLTKDQLLSIGLAAHMFGTPAGAPSVVATARELAVPVLDEAAKRQESGSRAHSSGDASLMPGKALFRAIRKLRWTGSGVSDMLRQVSRSALPHALSASECSPHAAVAVPRILGKRIYGMTRRG